MMKRQTRAGMVCRLCTEAVKHWQDKPRLGSRAQITRKINQLETSLYYFVAKKDMNSVILNTSDSLFYLSYPPCHASPGSSTIFLWSITKTFFIGPIITRLFLFGLKGTAIFKAKSIQLKLLPHDPAARYNKTADFWTWNVRILTQMCFTVLLGRLTTPQVRLPQSDHQSWWF